MNRNLLVIVALRTLLPAIASAASFTSPVRDVASISEPESGATRLLFTADLAVPEEHVALRRALLRVPVGSRESTEQMVLRVHPGTTAWSRGAVDWSSGWTRAGGDFEDLVYGWAEVSAGQSEVVFDVSIPVKEILEYGAANRGFLVTVEPAAGLGLRAADAEALRLSNASLDVSYRQIPRPPRSHRGE